MTASTLLNMRQMSSLRKKNMSTPNSFTSNHHRRPFCKWDIYFMTCHPASSNGHKYIVVEVYYFSKWVKAIPSFKTNAHTTTHFVFNHVISRFWVPLQLVFDNGKQFENEIFAEISSKLSFSQKFASPYYLQSNGQVEVVNKVLKTVLQPTVNKHKTN